MTKKSIDPLWWLLLLVGPLFVASTIAAFDESSATGDALLRECESVCEPHVVLECSSQNIVCIITASREP